MIKKTLGGDRLGSGNNQEVWMDGYHSSNHNLGYVWRSSMNAGTLIPFMKIACPKGDNFDIELTSLIKTIPTVGPLYGSFKYQLDVFVCPFRLYIGALHNNRTGVGMKMDKVLMPTITFPVKPKNVQELENAEDINLLQVAPDSLTKYLGISGLGVNITSEEQQREFNGIPYLAYADIFKNFYSNKQEKMAYMIGVGKSTGEMPDAQTVSLYRPDGTAYGTNPTVITAANGTSPAEAIGRTKNYQTNGDITKATFKIMFEIDGTVQTVTIKGTDKITNATIYNTNETRINCYFKITQVQNGGNDVYVYMAANNQEAANRKFNLYTVISITTQVETNSSEVGIKSFPLENIDEARDIILTQSKIGQKVDISESGDISFSPYVDNATKVYKSPTSTEWDNASKNTLNGILLRTYLSDMYNNWVRTEWIDEINAASAIQIDNGTFTMDALVISKRVWNYLNRVAVSGGTYQDWQEATWGRDAQRFSESPIYMGGASGSIDFEEVVATTQAANQPLGTLGGKGGMGGFKGGKINIKIQEPSYVIGIVSIVPRIDYYQGNDWDMTTLKTMNDIHKPEFDGIGFQDMIAENMAAWTTNIGAQGAITKKAVGKQPAWLHYMSNVNHVYGDFCREGNADFMVITRKYEPTSFDATTGIDIANFTAYVFPQHYNYLFAAEDIELQPFWVQIGCKIFARRIMSAAIMPTL